MPFHVQARGHALASILALLLAVLLQGCAMDPQRPVTGKQTDKQTGQQTASRLAGGPCIAPAAADKRRVTPEQPDDKAYTLHHVEFDDQGWTFPDAAAAGQDAAHTPGSQIDCAIAGLKAELAGGATVMSFVYVHGWKHSSHDKDPDLEKFRELLRERHALFQGKRSIVGIYVSWQGNTWDVWGLQEVTFWGRKNAAQRVADGRVRELFSRVRGLRSYWNGPRESDARACDAQAQAQAGEPSVGADRCKLRTIMIGHSFGGFILYNSVEPYLLEMLSIHRDLPPGASRPPAFRATGIADLIVLLNPAFEGSRHEPLFEVSRNYVPERCEQPLLVMLSSTADWATKNAFPAARWFNSIFQYPATSDAQSKAMRRTPGHIDSYLTHQLCLSDSKCHDAPQAAAPPDGLQLDRRRGRSYGSGLFLQPYTTTPPAIVWNVQTDGSIIPSHDRISEPPVRNFISQLYGEITGEAGDSCSRTEQLAAQTPLPAQADASK